MFDAASGIRIEWSVVEKFGAFDAIYNVSS